MSTSVEPIGGHRESEPTEVVDEAAAKHDPPRNRPNLGAFNEFIEVRSHLGMDRKLPKVRRCLNHDDPDVGAPNTTAGGAKEADMMTRIQVIIREDNPPPARSTGVRRTLKVSMALATLGLDIFLSASICGVVSGTGVSSLSGSGFDLVTIRAHGVERSIRREGHGQRQNV